MPQTNFEVATSPTEIPQVAEHNQVMILENTAQNTAQLLLMVPKLIYLTMATVQDLTSLISALMCPFSIFQNFQTCGLYFLIDMLALTIWSITFVIAYLFVGFPLWIWSSLLSLCLGIENYISSPDVVCPSKDSLCLLVETAYYNATGNYLLYRTPDDLSKCYCFIAIELFFQPYVDFYNVIPQSSPSAPKNVNNKVMYEYITVAIIVLLMMMIMALGIKFFYGLIKNMGSIFSLSTNGLPIIPGTIIPNNLSIVNKVVPGKIVSSGLPPPIIQGKIVS
jgi:hypothetical protein